MFNAKQVIVDEHLVTKSYSVPMHAKYEKTMNAAKSDEVVEPIITMDSTSSYAKNTKIKFVTNSHNTWTTRTARLSITTL